jgi:xanthine phosphoribosyltransferase
MPDTPEAQSAASSAAQSRAETAAGAEPGKFKNFPVSWDELHRHCKMLAWRLAPIGKWQGIIAITRGGLVPAAVVARELEVRLVDTICVASYDFQSQGELQVLKPFEGDGAGWLLLEDIVDTGVTMRKVRAMVPKAHVASVYVKPAGRDLVDTYVTEVSQDTWILFPWDMELQYAPPVIGGS